ncbi:MAG: DUF4190 domain-containing protein, partial [Myxococcales bacterium]|nr:DUF4190 domain-containing protein [Myxococcales bacterium]
SQLGSPFPQAAPFAQAAPFGQDPPLSPGLMMCPRCRRAIVQGAHICPLCRGITSPDGIYHGIKVNAPGATAALVYGIIGLFFCGVIFGPVAISKSNEAKRAMSSDPTLGGEGLATAGMVLGVLDLIFWGILLVMRLGTL